MSRREASDDGSFTGVYLFLRGLPLRMGCFGCLISRSMVVVDGRLADG